MKEFKVARAFEEYLEATINEAVKQGWEVVSIAPSSLDYRLNLILSKEKQPKKRAVGFLPPRGDRHV